MEWITTAAAAALIIFLLAAVEILVQQRINQILEFLNRDDD